MQAQGGTARIFLVPGQRPKNRAGTWATNHKCSDALLHLMQVGEDLPPSAGPLP